MYPNYHYKNKGWLRWKHWLGTEDLQNKETN